LRRRRFARRPAPWPLRQRGPIVRLDGAQPETTLVRRVYQRRVEGLAGRDDQRRLALRDSLAGQRGGQHRVEIRRLTWKTRPRRTGNRPALSDEQGSLRAARRAVLG